VGTTTVINLVYWFSCISHITNSDKQTSV